MKAGYSRDNSWEMNIISSRNDASKTSENQKKQSTHNRSSAECDESSGGSQYHRRLQWAKGLMAPGNDALDLFSMPCNGGGALEE